MKFLKILLLVFLWVTTYGALVGNSQELGNGLYANMETSKGEIVLKLYYKRAPKTVSNFIGLAEGTKKSNKRDGTPFYDGIIFHRVINPFMIQSGDPEGTGRGGPGFQFADEFHQHADWLYPNSVGFWPTQCWNSDAISSACRGRHRQYYY